GAAEADLVPGRGMRVVDGDDLGEEEAREEALRRQPIPRRALHLALLHEAQDVVLSSRGELAEGGAEMRAPFLLDRPYAAPPCLAHRRHAGVMRAVALVLVQHLVEPGDDRHRRRAAIGLWQEPGADRLEDPPLLLREKAPGRHLVEALLDRLAARRVPGGRVALRKDVIAGKLRAEGRAHGRASPSSERAPSPAIAMPVKPGGAGSGGPCSSVWLQLRQPPILRWMP